MIGEKQFEENGINYYDRALLVSKLWEKPVFIVENMKGGFDFFLAESTNMYNPSNHIHENRIHGYPINNIMITPIALVDRGSLEARLDSTPKLTLIFGSRTKYMIVSA